MTRTIPRVDSRDTYEEIPMTDFANLLEQARSYARHSYAANTRAAYASDWQQFRAWCAQQQRRALPATAETILGYIVTLAERLSPASIDRRLCGIAFHHRQARQSDPTDDPEVAITMRGLRRAKGTAAAGKLPITPALLVDVLATCGTDRRGIQERALLLLGFAGAFRRSELVALTLDDLTLVDDGLIVRVRRSKTDQEGSGSFKGIPHGTQATTCPVQAMQTWIAVGKIRSGPLFRAFSPHGRQTRRPLPAYAVARIIQRTIRQCNLDPRHYGGHSLRAGLVTAAAQAGVAERIIMRQTGHTDVRTVRRYIRDGSLFAENAAAQVGL